ncbi:hypothetical protein ZWY2020_005202 [Hordeum vulgare]|nr:hypothetical protein ZWY2020_005202 [Hordeum vulgare]
MHAAIAATHARNILRSAASNEPAVLQSPPTILATISHTAVHDNMLRKQAVSSHRVVSVAKLRRNACLAGQETPFYKTMAQATSMVKAAKFTCASAALKNAVASSFLCESDDVPPLRGTMPHTPLLPLLSAVMLTRTRRTRSAWLVSCHRYDRLQLYHPERAP